MIQNGDRTKFDVEVLKQLLKLLPEKHEVCTIAGPHLESRRTLVSKLRAHLKMTHCLVPQCRLKI